MLIIRNVWLFAAGRTIMTNSSYFTELALRAGALGVGGKPDDGSDAIGSRALDHANGLIQSSAMDDTEKARQIQIQHTAITAAIVALQAGVATIQRHKQLLESKRLGFDQERLTGVATFRLPTDIEEARFSQREWCIKAFLGLQDEYPTLRPYFGINADQASEHNTEQGSFDFYSILPLYRMSEHLAQPLASTTSIDKERISINLFFKVVVQESIERIGKSFLHDYKFIQFFKSAFEKRDYLNNRRLPRFVLMSLANLLWNLQHPVDPKTGAPLRIDECVGLCRNAMIFLNRLLDEKAKFSLHRLIDNEEKKELIRVCLMIEQHIKALHASYLEQQLYEINIVDVVNMAYKLLRGMDNALFMLIFKKPKEHGKKFEFDSQAAERITQMVDHLHRMLSNAPEIVREFESFRHDKPIPYVNSPLKTVVDVLIVFCHLSTADRRTVFKKISKYQNENALQFYEELKSFEKLYVKPIRSYGKLELKRLKKERDLREKLQKKTLERRGVSPSEVHNFPEKPIETIEEFTGKRLIPLITLILQDYRIRIDGFTPVHMPKTVPDHFLSGLSAREQVLQINRMAASGIGYYQYQVSPFIQMDALTEGKLDELPCNEYRLTRLTELLDMVSDIVNHYRHFLQLKSFQVFLLKFIQKLKSEYSALNRYLDEIESCLDRDQQVTRDVKGLLHRVLTDLTRGLDGYLMAISNLERVAGDPKFPEQQRLLLSEKIELIDGLFRLLFNNEDSGITHILNDTQDSLLAQNNLPLDVNYHQPLDTDEMDANRNAMKQGLRDQDGLRLIAIKEMIYNCRSAMSSLSKNGHKGSLLNQLELMVDKLTPPIQDETITAIVLELVKITASYRSLGFFHADYAQTRSAKALIRDILDPEMNARLNLIQCIFGMNLNPQQVTVKQVVHRLSELRASNQWKENVKQIDHVSICSS